MPKCQPMPFIQSFIIKTYLASPSIHVSTRAVFFTQEAHRCLWLSNTTVQQQMTFTLAAHGQSMSIVIFCSICTNAVEAHGNMWLLWVSGFLHLPSLLWYTTKVSHYVPCFVVFVLVSRSLLGPAGSILLLEVDFFKTQKWTSANMQWCEGIWIFFCSTFCFKN